VCLDRGQKLPCKVYGGGLKSRPTIRYKFPLFLVSPLPASAPVVTFSYVDSAMGSISGSLTYVGAYQPLFQQLRL
jgi:hypothetical protein